MTGGTAAVGTVMAELTFDRTKLIVILTLVCYRAKFKFVVQIWFIAENDARSLFK